jgi:hypothetical protein
MGVLLVTECLYFDVLRTILVGNFSDGTINAFDSTGESLGQVTDSGIWSGRDRQSKYALFHGRVKHTDQRLVCDVGSSIGGTGRSSPATYR